MSYSDNQEDVPKRDARFQEISRERVADRVAQELLRMIARGDLLPGERLPGERDLAQLMGVSRVSVRAALQQLKGQGLVAATQGGSTRVVATSEARDPELNSLLQADHDNFRDLAELRGALEIWAVRRAARHRDAEDLREIAQLYEVMADEQRHASDRARDSFKFHLAIAKASKSAVYYHLLTVLSDAFLASCSYLHNELFRTPELDQLFLDQQREILTAIQSGDENAASQAMAEHLETILSRHASLSGKANK